MSYVIEVNEAASYSLLQTQPLDEELLCVHQLLHSNFNCYNACS